MRFFLFNDVVEGVVDTSFASAMISSRELLAIQIDTAFLAAGILVAAFRVKIHKTVGPGLQ